MILRLELIQRAPGLSNEAFRRRWRGAVADCAAQLPGLRRHEQNHVIDHVQRGIDYRRGPEQLDGLSAFWFDDEAAMQAAMASDAGRALADSGRDVIGQRRSLLIEPIEVIAPDDSRPLIKRMSTLRRRAGVSTGTFRHEWHDLHARLVKRIPQVRGYRQNPVLAREAPAGAAADYAALPIDGIVELWFDDAATLDAAFASPPGATLMTHALEFIDEITTFLVERHVIV